PPASGAPGPSRGRRRRIGCGRAKGGRRRSGRGQRVGAVGRRRDRGRGRGAAGDVVKAEALEEVVHGDARDADAERLANEVEQVGAGGGGVGQEERGKGAGVAGQELAVRAAVHAVVRLLDCSLGRDALLAGGGGPTDAEQAGELRDLKAAVAVEQEVGEQAGRVVIGAAAL